MSTQSASIRPPAAAGTFYPRQPEALRAQVDELLLSAPKAAAPFPKALIVPHAGYVYSGPVAASAYAELHRALSEPDKSAAARIERVVLLGPAHRVYVSGIAGPGAARFLTPLGSVEVDQDWLARLKGAAQSPRAHAAEHCLEVQLPFLQRLLPRARVVPLLVSDAPSAVVGDALLQLWGGKETLIVISSDLSHYLPYATARSVDEETARRILAGDDSLDGERACGCAAINGLLHIASKKGLYSRLLDLRNSGDTAGSRDAVVGYAAFAFYEEKPCPN